MNSCSALDSRTGQTGRASGFALGAADERTEVLAVKRLAMKLLHGARKGARQCVNGAGHAKPRINPRTGKPYTRCEACRSVHRVLRSVHVAHPTFASTTACGRESTNLRVTFGGPVVTCKPCRRVLLRMIGGAA